ncbi:hypothetical protein FRX31_027445 [Thalictrum thalictroides]|uniref:Uncharacterized protein n=1 Tax=Thalictrum thalictroides TaxID=46969 RepID=A0A7J6VEB2_THATH|nr:hypothetical protein FRX31_027445 [Thalictrum thalictroides]
MVEVEDEHGGLITQQELIKDYVVHSFEDLCKASNNVIDQQLLSVVPKLITEEQNAELIKIPDMEGNLNWQNFKSKLCDVISNRNWDLPDSVHEIFHRVGIDMSRVMPPNGEEDYKIWKPDQLGVFSVKSAFNTIRKKEQNVW